MQPKVESAWRKMVDARAEVAVKLRLRRNTARRQRDDAHVKARRFESSKALCEVTEIQILAADLKNFNGGKYEWRIA